MIRSELIERLVQENPGLRTSEVEAILDGFFGSIVDKLAVGGRVELRGFGTFSVRSRDAREGRNPRTGATVAISPKNVPYFKAGKEMRARINGG